MVKKKCDDKAFLLNSAVCKEKRFSLVNLQLWEKPNSECLGFLKIGDVYTCVSGHSRAPPCISDFSGWLWGLPCMSPHRYLTDVSCSSHFHPCGEKKQTNPTIIPLSLAICTGNPHTLERFQSTCVTYPSRLPMIVWRNFLAEIWPSTFL